jgi:tRNA (cmo5U34)-methyltransferase
MIELANTVLGPLADRVCFHHGYLDRAPAGPFDAAACLLTLHFLPREERRETLAGIFGRLKSGAALVVAHHSFRTDGPEIDKWLLRNAAYAAASGLPARRPERSIAAFKERLPILSPEEDTALLAETGFVDVELFYCGFTIKGWVAHKP